MGIGWINTGQNRVPVVESREHSNEFSCSTKHKEYLFQVRNYQLLKEECALRSYIPKTVQALHLVEVWQTLAHLNCISKDMVVINPISWVKTDGLRNFVAINAVCNTSMDRLFYAPSK